MKVTQTKSLNETSNTEYWHKVLADVGPANTFTFQGWGADDLWPFWTEHPAASDNVARRVSP